MTCGFDSRTGYSETRARRGFTIGKGKSRPLTRPKSRPVERNVLLTEFKQQKAREMLYSYRPALLYQGAKHWYIYYYYLIPGTTEYQRFKEYFDINRIRNLRERKVWGEEAVAFMNKKLAEGFNPFKVVQKKNIDQSGTVLKLLNTVVDDLKADATIPQKNSYNTMLTRFEDFIEEEELGGLRMLQVDIDIANSFRDYLVNRKLAKKTINGTLSHLGLFWDEVIRRKMAVTNPFRQAEKVKKDKRTNDDDEDIFEPLTSAEMDAIIEHHNKTNLRKFMTYWAMIYCAWARPVEVCRLVVEDINLKDDVIRFKKGQTKNDKGAFVQIIPQLKKLLLEMELDRYPKKWHLFSTEDYMPGPKQKDPQYPLDKWTREVVNKLKIDKRMYALKHTGNIEYLLRNKGKVDLKWQQMQNRHSSVAMTERYNRKLGAYFIDCGELKFREL